MAGALTPLVLSGEDKTLQFPLTALWSQENSVRLILVWADFIEERKFRDTENR